MLLPSKRLSDAYRRALLYESGRHCINAGSICKQGRVVSVPFAGLYSNRNLGLNLWTLGLVFFHVFCLIAFNCQEWLASSNDQPCIGSSVYHASNLRIFPHWSRCRLCVQSDSFRPCGNAIHDSKDHPLIILISSDIFHIGKSLVAAPFR